MAVLLGQSYLDAHDSRKLLYTLAAETRRVSAACTGLASMIINVCMGYLAPCFS